MESTQQMVTLAEHATYDFSEGAEDLEGGLAVVL